jgi:hypothetical protein
MNSRVLLFLGVVSMGCMAEGIAQDPALIMYVPATPFVKMPPPGSQWSMTIKSKNRESLRPSDSKNDASRPMITPVGLDMRIGTNRFQEGAVTYSDGSRKVFYLVEEYVLQRFDNSEKIAAFPIVCGEGFTSLRTSLFPGVSWLSAANYSGREMLEKVECDKFIMNDPDISQKFPLSAWIRIQDRYPVRVQLGETTYQFSEVTSFPQEVQLPARYLAALEKLRFQQRLIKRLKANVAK